MEKLLNETNCFFYRGYSMNNPFTAEELVKMEAHEKMLATEREAGKHLIQTNCPHYEAIIRGALKINLTKSEMAVFRENFWGHKYYHYNEGPHFDKAHRKLDITALLDEIFNMADSFDNPILGTYFAQSAYNDAQSRATKYSPSQSLLLKKAFKIRLAERNATFTDPSKVKTKESAHGALPTFENALKEPDKLPGLWKRLAKMKNPLVSESGQFILQGRPHAALLAFAQAMKSKDKLQEKITINDVYYILCARFNVSPAISLRQVRRGKRDLIEHFEAFNDVLREG